jgi:transposase
LVLVDALGNLVRFSLWPGQRHDSVGALDLIDGLTFEALLGDKAFDNNSIRDDLDRRGAEAVIPSKADRKQPIPHDKDKYRWRHLVENYFSKIKEFRAVNTRYDKTDLSYKATISIAAIAIALR